MATWNSSTSNYGYYLQLTVECTSQNQSDLKSNIKWTLKMISPGSAYSVRYSGSNGGTFKVIINGTTCLNETPSAYSVTADAPFVRTGTSSIKHNADGTKSFNVSFSRTASQSVGAYTPVNAMSGSGTMTLPAITVGTKRNWTWDSDNFPNFVYDRPYKINIDSSSNCRAIAWLALDENQYVGPGTYIDSPSPNPNSQGVNWMPLKINGGSSGVIAPGTSSFTITIPSALRDKISLATRNNGAGATLSIDTYTGNFSAVSGRAGNIGSVRRTFKIYDGPGLWYNDNGTWRAAKSVWYNDNGTWRKAKSVFYNDNGTWRKAK